MLTREQGLAEMVELTVPARAEFVRLVRLVMAGIGNSLDFTLDEIDDLKMAVSEAYNMFHLSEEHPLHLRTSICPHELMVEVSQVCREGEPLFVGMDSATEKGIGLVLMRHLMDRVECSTEASEMRIRLVKRRIHA